MSTGTPMGGASESQARADELVDEITKPSRLRGLSDWWNHLPRVGQWGFLLIAVAAAFALPLVNIPLVTTEPGNNWPLACAEMARYALVAIGLNVVVGQAGLLDLGYVGFFAVGAYVAALWTSPDSTMVHIPYLLTLPLAAMVTVVFGVLLGIPTLRLRGDYLAIVTLGFGEIIRLLATIIPALKGQVGFQQIGRPPGENADGNPVFANSEGAPWYWLTITVIIVVMIALGNLERSRVGRNWIALREDEDAAEIMGVPTFRYKLWAFGIGAALGGSAGAIAAGQIGFVNNQRFDVQMSIMFLVAVVLGGQGNKFGAIIGGALVAYIPLRFTAIAEYKYLIFGAVLVVLMIFRPQGLFGKRPHLLTFERRAHKRIANLADAPTSAPAAKEAGQ